MNICSMCGKENTDDSKFCFACGATLSFDNQKKNPQETFTMNPNQPNSNNNYSMPNSYEKKNPGAAQFVSADEVVVATLSNGFVDNIITGEGFKHETAVVTNKRLYYNYKRGVINRVRTREIIDIQDITGTKILSVNYLFILIIAGIYFFFLLLVLGMVTFVFVLVVAYFVSLKKHLRIEYAGGSISFSVRGYRMSNIQAFQKAIYIAKDEQKY